MKSIIFSFKAPKPLGAYSQAIRSGDFLFLSGMTGVDPESGKLVEGGIRSQTKQIIKNIEAVISEAGLGLKDLIKMTVFLKDMEDFKDFNEVYSEFFIGEFPVRTTVQAMPPANALIEIEAIASPVK